MALMFELHEVAAYLPRSPHDWQARRAAGEFDSIRSRRICRDRDPNASMNLLVIRERLHCERRPRICHDHSAPVAWRIKR
jgi:hypothetical protein